MNRVYRLVWNELRHAWIAVAECVRTHGKRASGALLLAAAVASAPTFAEPAPTQLPSGGQIVGGAGSIAHNGSAMTVTQTTPKMIANWQSFDIGAKASVTFQQPNAASIALNRVTNQNPTHILGNLNANGQVMIINPAGIVFGRGSQVNVGALTASTLAISDAQFMAGQYKFAGGSGSGAIVNQGKIEVPKGGYVAFIAPTAKNEGEIHAPQGTVVLAAAHEVDLDFNGDGLITVKVKQSALDALAENNGLIRADEGVVILTAGSAKQLLAGAVNNSGVIEARGMTQKGGRIVLDGGAVKNTGTLDVSSAVHPGGTIAVSGKTVELGGTLNASGSSGGRIALEATDSLTVSGTLTTQGTAERGGAITLDAGATLSQTATARLDASGKYAGGEVILTSRQNIAVRGAINAATSAHETANPADDAIGFGGSIRLVAQHSLALDSALLDASGAQGGGRIHIEAAAHPLTSDPVPTDPPLPEDHRPTLALTGATIVRTSSSRGQGGTLTLSGERIGLWDATLLDATGTSGGGVVLVGGDWQGQGTERAPFASAHTVVMGDAARIDASALKVGAGGTVVLWSDVHNSASMTSVKGRILAKGGAEGGDGGRIETSGHAVDLGQAKVSAAAAAGTGGLWLIDPTDATIDQTVANSYASTLNGGTSVENVVTGSITWNSGVTLTKNSGGDATLTLKASDSIVLGAGSSIVSTNNKLNVVLWADTDASGGGYIQLANTGATTDAIITTNGGGVWMGGSTTSNGSTTWTPYSGATALTVGDGFAKGTSTYGSGVYLGAGTISTGGGNIAIYGQTAATGTSTTQPDGVNAHSGIYSIFSGGAAKVAKLDAGTGTILLSGKNVATDSNLLTYEGIYLNGATLTSAATSGNAITLIGDASSANWGTDTRGAGITMIGWTNQPVSISATGGGDIAISGTSTTTTSSNTALSNGVRVSSGGAGTSISTTGGGNIAITGTQQESASSKSVSFETANDSISSSGNLTITGTTSNGNNKPIVLNGPVQVVGTTTLTASGQDITATHADNDFTGALSIPSGANVSITDKTALVLGNTNTTGVQYYAAGGAISGSGNLTTSGYDLTLETAGGSGVLSGAITLGSGGLTIVGSGTTILTGANSYSGSTTIMRGPYPDDGTLQVGAGGTAGSLGSGAVSVNNATLIFNRSDNLTVSNPISGNGALTKSGANTLTLTGAQTYSGATTVSAGSLVFSNDAKPSTSGFLGNGSLVIEPSGTSFSSAIASSDYTFASTLTGLTLGKAGNTANITVGSATSVAGAIAVYGGDLALNAHLTTTTSNKDILLKASGSITQAAGVAVTTSGGNAIYSADSDSNNSGRILLSAGSSINTGGGVLVLGGGTCSTASCTAPARGSAVHEPGIYLLGSAGNPVTLNTAGGAMWLHGKGSSSGGAGYPDELRVFGYRRDGGTQPHSGGGSERSQ